jgi:hypothetical protein
LARRYRSHLSASQKLQERLLLQVVSVPIQLIFNVVMACCDVAHA